VPAHAGAPLPFAGAPDGGQKLTGQDAAQVQQGPLSGHVLGGKYEVHELLGRGGVGAVYKAYNRLLKRPQAIKVLLEHYGAEPKVQARFRREAQTLAALDHATILHVDDFGVEDNRVYLVMPFISGGTLQQFLHRHPDLLSFEQVLRAIGHMAAALDHAHARGVVHLDLKPANVLLHPDGRLLLADFGLAHLLEAGAVEGGTSLQFGTPAYMAPEQIEGKPEAASDIYALGIILYQLLTGKVPFQGSSPLAILRKQATEPPPALRTSRPELPLALESVLGKALAKEPAARYQTAGALRSAFQSAISAS
jgi:serine/threonine-protein kinase